MASVTLNVSDRHAPGVVVGAYPRANWAAWQLPPSGTAVGTATATGAVAANGTVTITGLADATSYYAAKSDGVGGYVAFSTPALASAGAGSSSDLGMWAAAAAAKAGDVALLPDGTRGTRLPGSPSSNRAQWDAVESSYWKVTSPRLSPFEFTPMTALGHSWCNGGPDISTGARAADRLANRVKALPFVNLGAAGLRMDEILSSQVSAVVVNAIGWVWFMDGTINDGVQYGDTTGLTTTQEAFRTALSILSARIVVPNSNGSLVFGGGASAANIPTSGYVDVGFTGDAIDIQFGMVTGAGGTFTIYNAGVSVGTLATGGYKQNFTGTKRISGYGAGNHTLRVTATSGSGTVVGAAIPSAYPQQIVWVHSADRNTGAPSVLLAQQYSDAAQTVAATFANVIVVSIDSMWDQTRYVGPGFHPNDLGMAYLANKSELAMATVVHRQGLNQLSLSTQEATYTPPAAAYNSPGATAPAAPVLAAATGTQVALTWTAPADNGSTILSYKVQSSPAGAGTWTDVATPGPNVRAMSVSGLTATSSYDFRLTATNGVGTSAQSATATATAGAAVTVLFSATFPDADGTDLTSMAASPWTRNTVYSAAAAFTDGANKVRSSGSTSGYYSPYTPGTADYTVKARFTWLSTISSEQKAITARMSTSVDTMYMARYIQGTGWRLTKKVAGTLTDIGATNSSFPLDASNTFRDVVLTCAGTTISVTIDGVSVWSVTDSAIAAAGRGGLYAAVGANTASTGVHIGTYAITT